MKKLGEKLKAIVEHEAKAFDLFVVHHTVSPTGLFRFYVDSQEVLSMKVLADFTKQVSNIIDEGDFGEHPFTFEISSPGADAPLRDFRQFHKHIGRSFEIHTQENSYTGKLEAIEGDILKILNEYKEKGKKKIEIQAVDVPFSDINEAKIIISFK
jgi:ribosome maturation factor RimP